MLLKLHPLKTWKNCEHQMGFEPKTLRDLEGCSNNWALYRRLRFMSKGEMWVFDLNCIAQLQSQVMTDSIAHNCIAQSPLSISEMRH